MTKPWHLILHWKLEVKVDRVEIVLRQMKAADRPVERDRPATFRSGQFIFLIILWCDHLQSSCLFFIFLHALGHRTIMRVLPWVAPKQRLHQVGQGMLVTLPLSEERGKQPRNIRNVLPIMFRFYDRCVLLAGSVWPLFWDSAFPSPPSVSKISPLLNLQESP